MKNCFLDAVTFVHGGVGNASRWADLSLAQHVMKWTPRLILVSLFCLVCALTFTWSVSPPTSAEIRLDTGDLRYVRMGQVVEHQMMPEPYRSTLLAAAEDSDILRNRWHQCATFPLPTSNNSHRMCQGFYMDAAAWLATDREIGLFVAEDVARYVETTNAEYSLPSCIELLHWGHTERDGELLIDEGWEDDEYVTYFLREQELLE